MAIVYHNWKPMGMHCS